MKILQDIDKGHRLPGIEAIEARSAWWFHEKRPEGGYHLDRVDMRTVIDHDAEKPVGHGLRHVSTEVEKLTDVGWETTAVFEMSSRPPILLNLELKGPEFEEQLWQILPVVAYYRSRYPNHKLGIWKHVPAFYPSNDGSPVADAILNLVDFVTVRGYMATDWNQWLYSMTAYLSRASRLGKPVYFYFAPHFVHSNAPISPRYLSEVIEYCRHVWPVEAFVIWTNKNVPTDVDPDAEWRKVVLEAVE